MKIVSCNICGNPTYDVVYENLVDHHFKNQEFTATFVRCTKCSLIYQNPQPDETEISLFYPKGYESHLEKKVRGSLAIKGYDYGLYKRWKFVLHQKKEGRLLDIGCATGDFLAHKKNDHGWKLYGIEMDREVAEIARKTSSAEILSGALDSVDLPVNFFDVITMWEVLEHLIDPHAALNTIYRALKPGGTLILRVPNGNGFDRRLFGSAWAGLDPPRHLYVFTKQTLARLLEMCGFKLIASSCQSGGYSTFRISIKFMLEADRQSALWKKWVLCIINHPFTQGVIAPIFFIIDSTMNGPTLILTAIKPE